MLWNKIKNIPTYANAENTPYQDCWDFDKIFDKNINGVLININGIREIAEVKVISWNLLSPSDILVAAKEAGIHVIGTKNNLTASNTIFASSTSIDAKGKCTI